MMMVVSPVCPRLVRESNLVSEVPGGKLKERPIAGGTPHLSQKIYKREKRTGTERQMTEAPHDGGCTRERMVK